MSANTRLVSFVLPVHHSRPRVPIIGRRSSNEMVEKHGQIVTCVSIGKGHGRTREMSITECMTQHDGILNVVRPIRPVGVLLNQRLKDNVRSFVGIRGNIVVVEFEMLEKCGVAHIGYAVARRLLVALSVDQEVGAFVTIGTQQQRTFLEEYRRDRRTTRETLTLKLPVLSIVTGFCGRNVPSTTGMSRKKIGPPS